jgi:hypothetical protein
MMIKHLLLQTVQRVQRSNSLSLSFAETKRQTMFNLKGKGQCLTDSSPFLY